MTQRNRRPDWRLIKTLRSYTIDEVACVLRVHRNSVRYWIKQCGLPVLAERRPHLIHGADLVAFLKGRRAARRQKCGPGQFFCMKCRQPRAPMGGMVDYEPITYLRGSFIGKCPACETLMRRFVSRAQLDRIGRELSIQNAHLQESLRDTFPPSVYCLMNAKD